MLTTTRPNASSLTEIVFDQHEYDPDLTGVSVAARRKIELVFDQQIANKLHYGAQLVVLRHGKLVLDRAAGWANLKDRLPVKPETRFHCFSISKSFTGICVHKLIEQGKLELDTQVSAYWPEFGCRGKQNATIRHVFLHQAGIPSRDLRTRIPLWLNWGLITASLARLPAEFQPGSKTSYHAVNYGFILGELVRRVTGMPFNKFLAQEFLEPLNLRHTHMGLPRKLIGSAARIYSGDPQQASLVTLFNLPFIRAAEVPAATLNSSARNLAVFFQMLLNGGLYANRSYLRPETILQAVSLGAETFDEYIGNTMRWAYGFHLGGLRRPSEPAGGGMGYGSSLNTFGHFGQNSSMAWADSQNGLVVCLTTNRLLPHADNMQRFKAISDAVWDAVLE